MSNYPVITLTADQAHAYLDDLIDLLRDAVDGGAAVGFLPPLSIAEARDYWLKTLAEVADGSRCLLAYLDNGHVVGSLQLELAMRPNGRHRAEVAKVLVHSRYRRRGIGRALLTAVEATARAQGRSTLVLDTREGDAGETLYRAMGWLQAGVIPQFARSANGELHATVIFYRLLE